MGLGRGRGFGYGRGRGIGSGRGKGAFSGYTCVKFTFFIFNVVFWLLGCAIIGIGIWLQVSKGNYASIIPSVSFLGASVLCIVAGVLILIIGFFGCCGAIMENQCMLLTYFILVIVIFVLETIASVLAFVYRRDIEETVSDQLLMVIKEKWSEDDDGEEGWKEGWAYTQHTLKCCGVDNYTDWFNIKAWPGEDRVPEECCLVEKCNVHGPPALWHQEGCLHKFKDEVEYNLYIVGITCIGIVIIQIFGMAAAIVMFCCLRSEKYYYG